MVFSSKCSQHYVRLLGIVLQFLTLGFHFGAFSCIDMVRVKAHNHVENIELSTIFADFLVQAGMSSNLTAPTIFSEERATKRLGEKGFRIIKPVTNPHFRLIPIC
jgi:hypothetical protein